MERGKKTNSLFPNFEPPKVFSNNPFDLSKPKPTPRTAPKSTSKPTTSIKNNLVERLYKGEKKRIDSGGRAKSERVQLESVQGKEVIKKCRGKCTICGFEYIKKPHQFEIHHIDGDPSNTVVANLTLLCVTHHKTIHAEVKTKIADYKAKKKQKDQK